MNDELHRTIGEELRQQRERKGLSVDDVANILKINPAYIRALESGDSGAFPAEVFFRGFLKNYARYIGVDEALLSPSVEAPPAERTAEPAQPPEPQSPKPRTRAKIPIRYVVIGGICLAIVLSWLRVVQVNRRLETEIEKRKATGFKALTTSKELALHEEKKKLLDFGSKEKNELVVKAKDTCWVEIRYDGHRIYQGLLLSGEQREFSLKKGMIVKLGNAGGVELSVRGDVRKDLGRPGEVREIVID